MPHPALRPPAALLLLAGAVLACGRAGDPASGTPQGGPGPARPGSGDVFARDMVSGTRLKAQRLVGPDGAQVLRAEWYDSELRRECAFDYGSADRRYCLPRQRSNPTVFADAACTVRLVASAARAGCPTRLVMEPTSASAPCDRVPKFFELGAPVNVTTVYHDLPGATPSMPRRCVAGSVPEGFTLRAVGPEVPLSRFVSATRRELPLGGGLTAYALEASDGARQLEGIYDRAHGMKCLPATTPQGIRCLPVDPPRTNRSWRDATCREPVLHHHSFRFPGDALWERYTNCQPPGVGEGPPVSEGCGRVTRTFVSLGAPVRAQTLYQGGSICRALGDEQKGSDTFFEPGAPLAMSAFPALTVAGDGLRLRTDYFQAGGVALRGWSRTIFDTTLGTTCAPGTAGDGVERCLPADETLSYRPPPDGGTYFEDAACTKPLAIDTNAVTRCAMHVFRFAHTAESVESTDGCRSTTRYRIYPLGPRVTAPLVYKRPAGTTTCLEERVFSANALYPVGPEIPPGELAAFEPAE